MTETHIHVHIPAPDGQDNSEILAAIEELRTTFMTQLETLRSAIGAVGTNLGTLGTDISALSTRIDALGGPDLDTSAEAAELMRIANALSGTSDQVNSMAGGTQVAPEAIPVVEPAVNIPADPEAPIEPPANEPVFDAPSDTTLTVDDGTGSTPPGAVDPAEPTPQGSPDSV